MVDVEKVLLNLDIPLTSQRGDEVQGLCPMHKARTGNEDHNPSWWINLGTGVHFCFSCGYKGNVYTLVADLKGMDFFDAKEFVEKESELEVGVLLRRIRELPQYVPSSEDDIGMSEARLAVYTDVPDNELRKRFLTKESVDKYGVLWDKQNEAWILPIRDPNSFALMGWQEKGAKGRFFRNQPMGVKKSKTLFGINLVPNDEMWVVVESPLDAVRLGALGYHGVATFGAIMSEDQGKLLRRASVVYAAFDNDDAGKKASEQMLGFARRYGMELKFFNYAGITVKDVGDMTAAEVHFGIKSAIDRVWGKTAYGA